MKGILGFLLIMAVFFSDCPQAFSESRTENYSASGKIHFIQYYSIGGKKCAAFLEQSDGKILCVVDSPTVYNLKQQIKNSSGDVKLIGVLNSDTSNEFLDVEKYDIVTEDKSNANK